MDFLAALSCHGHRFGTAGFPEARGEGTKRLCPPPLCSFPYNHATARQVPYHIGLEHGNRKYGNYCWLPRQSRVALILERDTFCEAPMYVAAKLSKFRTSEEV